MMFKKWLGIFCLGTAAALLSKDVIVLQIKPARRHAVAEQGFVLKQDLGIRIKATGAEYRGDPIAYAWILEKKSRSVVWNMAESNTDRGSQSYNRTFDGTIRLSKGEYELYFVGALWSKWKYGWKGPGNFWENLFGGDSWPKWDKASENWTAELWVDEKDQNAVESTIISDADSALVKLAPLGDDESESEHISLKTETSVRIYAVGEGVDGEMADYGWIVRDDTGDEIWTMEYDDTKWAGGGEKNRMVDKTITLPAGDYTVSFITDDSHSFEEWNAITPYDPRHWGLTLWPADRSAETQFILKPKKVESDRDVIVQLTRVGDDQMEESGFTLTQPTQVRILCLGELGHDDRFADYGWILNAKTRETVWEMTRLNTKHAGGAKKNKIFNGIIKLDPGSYEVYYLTDDSHAYRDWNAGPPRDPEAWGITLRAVGNDFDPNSIKSYQEESDPDILVKCIRAGDDENLRGTFILREPAKVRVYSIGEGRDGDLFDYGYIEDQDGRRVWKMQYEDTEYAGGARKNRMANKIIQLPAGTYSVHFRTDDSHSFDEWNDDPPRDPVHWGITVSLVR